MSPCPTEDSLRAFLSGAVAAAEEESLGDHLNGCPDCLRRLETLDGSADPLVGALRGASPGSTGVVDPAVLKVIAQAAPPHPPTGVGDRLGPYLLLEKLAEGGIGAVFRARHEKLGKVFALKVLPAGRHLDPARAARFEREWRAVGRLNDPHIVQATDAGEHAGVPFLVMELVDGVDLARLVKHRGPLRPADACEVVRQAALALQHAHDQGLVHRDVKPSNLLLTADGVVKLLDLGLALATGDAEPPAPTAGPPDGPTADGFTLTLTGLALGTRHYMAPEQASAPHLVDARADVYGLGATLHYLLTGRPPGNPVPVPGGLSGVLARMLAPHPADRYPTAGEAAAALARRVRGHDLRALMAGRPPRSRRRLAAAGVGLLAAGGLLTFALLRRTAEEPSAAPSPDPVAEATPPVPPARAPVLPPAPPPDRGRLGMNPDEAKELQLAWADHLVQRIRVTGPAGVKLVLVPPGTFELVTRYTVTITRPYRLSETEVTVGQFKAFVAATKYVPTGEAAALLRPLGVDSNPRTSTGTWRDPGYPVDDDHPVTHVSHLDAQAFAEWLSRTEGRKYRLPTEAEWRWACRAGAKTRWPFGADPKLLSDYAIHKGSSARRPASVAGKRPNAWGLHDMLGNVREWVADGYPTYPEGTHVDPVLPARDSRRMLCGGDFDGQADKPERQVGWMHATCDCSTVMVADWWETLPSAGFRVLREE